MGEAWFRFFPSDWLGGTSGLSAAEKGVYVTLIALMYDLGGAIPRDDARLARQCGLPKAGLSKIIDTLLSLGKIEDEGQCLTNSRVKNELTERENRIGTARDGANVTNQKKLEKSRIEIRSSDRNSVRPELANDPPETRLPEPEPQSLREASASLVNVAVDPPPALVCLQKKRVERQQSDLALLDEITDIWNIWAKSKGSPTVARLTDERAKKCRKRIEDLKQLGFETPQEAFRGLLSKCETSFFVRGSPRSPLKFDQLMCEGFMTKMFEGNYEYRERNEVKRWAR